MQNVRVRFAPSPTGYLHIGGARTALFNWLFAQQTGGKFILRIEDTDRERLKEDSVSQILSSLKWLGMQWDEGPEVEGDFGPYYQSERQSLYVAIAKQLVRAGKAYYCFCTPEELAAEREKQRQAKQPFRYGRVCRNILPEVAEQRIAAGEKAVIRLKLPLAGEVVVEDLIHGEVSFALEQLDDFVILKSNGLPAYNFACVVDDHAMQISHVMRAEEHLSNTPKQVLLYQALDYEMPQFAHLPMILAPDRSKLSKRHGATSVEEFRDQGFLPQTIVNYLALLGWSPGEERELFTMREAVPLFQLDKVSKKAAIYDVKKLTWMNGQYLSRLPIDELLPEVKPFFLTAGLVDERWFDKNEAYFRQLIDVVRVRVKTLVELVDACKCFFSEIQDYDEKGVRKYFNAENGTKLQAAKLALTALDTFDLSSTEAAYQSLAEQNGWKLGELVHPSRLALTGKTVSPGLFDVMVLLGKQRTISRLDAAIALCI
jgi:glutamyl-tRNA synthetase